MNVHLKLVLIASALLVSACDEAPDASPASEPTCIPSALEFDIVRPILEANCGQCHGQSPAFGAPYSLLDYDELVRSGSNGRRVDRMLETIQSGEMPPASQMPMTSSDRNALVAWASCDSAGEPSEPNPGGFDVSRPLYPSPAQPPTESEAVEWRADGGSIDSRTSDRYLCYSFGGPVGDERFIRRFEPIIDDRRVLHHMVIYEMDDGPGGGREVDCGAGLGAIVYAWAPGAPALQFVEGGLKTSSQRAYMLEFHYNNAAGLSDVDDHSGVRVFHSGPAGQEIDMLTLGPTAFDLPALARTEVASDCLIEQETRVVALMPHMHEIGHTIETRILRADGTEEDLISLVGWDFNAQFIYDSEGVVLQSGDRLRTRCVFENPDETSRRFGPFTNDEMCFNFVYVSPPPLERSCSFPVSDNSIYVPGECAPDGAAESAGSATGPYRIGEPDGITGGELPTSGDWRVVGAQLWLSSADVGPATVVPEESQMNVAGMLRFSGEGQLAIDVMGQNSVVATGGLEVERAFKVSGAGEIKNLDTDAGTFVLETVCPQTGRQDLQYTFADGRLTTYSTFSDPIPGHIEITYELAQ